MINTEDIKGGGFPLRFQGLVKSGKYNPDKDRQWRSRRMHRGARVLWLKKIFVKMSVTGETEFVKNRNSTIHFSVSLLLCVKSS